MQFNPGDGSGIIDEIDALCDTNSTTYTVASKTRRVNSSLEGLVVKILKSSGKYQWDDPNNTTNPIGTFTLVEGQSKYNITDTFLEVEWIKIKDLAAKYILINPIDQAQLSMSYEEYFGTDTSGNINKGFPWWYDKDGPVITLFNTPGAAYCTLASGLQIGFRRTASLFATTDTTKVPGIASPFHVLLARMAALPYCQTYKKDRVPMLMALIGSETQYGTDGAGIRDLIEFYARREKDFRNIMTPKEIQFP